MTELGQFQEVESELAERLLEVRLIFELGLSREEHYELKETLRAVTRKWGGPEVVSLHYPAIYSTSLVFTGMYESQSGEVWEHTPPLIEENGNERGIAFVQALVRLQLETFQNIVDREPTQQYVMRILAHGGIPHAYLDKFSALLVEEIERGRTDPNTLLAEWVSNQVRLQYLQKATQRFLLDGGEPAVDFLARCLATLEEGMQTGTFPSAALAGLSVAVVEALADAAQGNSSKTGRQAGIPHPRLELDPYGDLGPRIVLPAITDGQGGRWSVKSGEGLPTSYNKTRLRDTIAPISPAGKYRVTCDTRDSAPATWEFTGPGSRGAIAFHPQTGQEVPYYGSFPLDEVHLVVPRVTKVSVEMKDPGADPSGENGLLPELTGDWSEWKQVHLDLNGVEKLLLTDDLGETKLSVVAPRLRPEIASEPVEAVTDEAGNPVFSRAPKIRLPKGHQSGTWRIRLRDPSDFELPFEVSASETSIDLADHQDGEAFGAFGLTVHGPLGSDLRTSFTTAPGLVVERPDRVWLPSHGTPEVKVLSDAPIDGAAPGELVNVAFKDDLAHAELLCEPESESSLKLRVHIDRLLWTVSHATKPTIPQAAHPLRIGREEFEDTLEDVILLSTGRSGVPIRLQLWEDGRLSQESKTATTMGAEGRWKFDLAPFSDQIRQAESASLELRLAIEGESVRLASIVAKTEPTKANSTRDAEGRLLISFEKTRDVRGIEARLWSLTRPWEGPIIAEVDESGASACFDMTVFPGRYLFTLDVPDDWSKPSRPDPLKDGALEIWIDDHARYQRHLEELDDGDPYAVLERVLAGSRNSGTGQTSISSEVLERVSIPAGLVCEEVLAQDGPDIGASRIDAIVDLFWESDTTLTRWLVEAAEAGAVDDESLTHISLRIVHRPEESGATWDEIDASLLERLWRFAPVVAAFFEVPYARTDKAVRSRCREYLGWVPGIDPDRGGGQLAPQDLRTVGQIPPTAAPPIGGSNEAETKPELRGLLSRDNLGLAKDQWLRRMDENLKSEWSVRETDLVARLDSLNSAAPFERKLWAILNSRRFPRPGGVLIEGWQDLPAIVVSDALAAAGLLDKEGRQDRRSITKLHQAVPTARRLIEHDLVLAIILRNESNR